MEWNTGDADFHYNKGVKYWEEDKIKEAIKEYKEAIRIEPDHASAHYNLGLAYRQQGRVKEAIGEYKKAIRIEPNYVEAHCNLGAAFWIEGQIEEAIEEYKKAIRLNPYHAPSHYNLGLAYKKQGFIEEATYHFQHALELGYERAQPFFDNLIGKIREKPIREKQTLSLKGHRDKVTAVALTSDCQYAISGSADCTVRVWNLTKKKEIHTLYGHDDDVLAVALRLDGQWAVSGSKDGSIREWYLKQEQKDEIYKMKGSTPFYAVALTPEGRVAVYIDLENIVQLCNVEDGKKLEKLHGNLGSVTDVALTPDGWRIAIGSKNERFMVWDMYEAKEILRVRCDRVVRAVALTPDGRLAIYADEDCTVRVWDPDERKELYTFTNHTKPVNALAVTRNGKRLVSASEDGIIKVWDLRRGELMTTVRVGQNLSSCAIAPDGVTIIAGDASGTIHFFQLEDIEPFRLKPPPSPDEPKQPPKPWWKFW